MRHKETYQLLSNCSSLAESSHHFSSSIRFACYLTCQFHYWLCFYNAYLPPNNILSCFLCCTFTYPESKPQLLGMSMTEEVEDGEGINSLGSIHSFGIASLSSFLFCSAFCFQLLVVMLADRWGKMGLTYSFSLFIGSNGSICRGQQQTDRTSRASTTKGIVEVCHSVPILLLGKQNTK